MGKLLSIRHAEPFPIAVIAGQTPKPPKPAAGVPLSDHLSDTLREAWFDRISDRLVNAEMGELNPHWKDDHGREPVQQTSPL